MIEIPTLYHKTIKTALIQYYCLHIERPKKKQRQKIGNKRVDLILIRLIDTWPYIFCTFRFKTILNHRSNILQIYANQSRGSSYVVVCSWDLQQPVKSVPITINVVGSNPVHGEVYSIQHYVIKFVSILRQVGSFPLIPPPIKLTSRYN